MASLAFLRHSALVGVGMTKNAIFCVSEIGAGFVAGRAILGQFRVTPQQSEACLFGMVEVGRVERPDIHIGALMVLVTDLAISADLAMDAFLGGDPVGDRPVAGETSLGVDRLPVGMAFPAVRFPLERRVSLGERPGSGPLCLGFLGGEGDDGD